MKSSRRTFLGGALAATVLSGVSWGAEEEREFPVLLLELADRRVGAEDSGTGLRTPPRLVAIDLESADDWGDVNRFWDGKSMSWGLGDDERGYRKIVRAFETHGGACRELSQAALSQLMDARVAIWERMQT